MSETSTFQYLISINSDLKQRYEEVKRMLVYASSSYYDAAGNLFEHYLKHVAKFKGIPIDNNDSHGKLFTKLRPYFIEELKIGRDAMNSAHSLSSRVNFHKHNQLLNADKDQVIDSLSKIFLIYSAVSHEENKDFHEFFDYTYYYEIFGCFSPVNMIQMFKEMKAKAKDLNKENQAIGDAFETKFEILVNLVQKGIHH